MQRKWMIASILIVAELALVGGMIVAGRNGLRWGISLTAIGLALCLSLYPIGLLPGMNFPLGIGPWMMVGFLPTFFGLGLVLIHVLTHEKSEAGPRPEPKEPTKQPLDA